MFLMEDDPECSWWRMILNIPDLMRMSFDQKSDHHSICHEKYMQFDI